MRACLPAPPPLSFNTITTSSSKPTHLLHPSISSSSSPITKSRLFFSFLKSEKYFSSLFAAGLTTTLFSTPALPLFLRLELSPLDEVELPPSPPSNSHTLNSLPRVETLTALPRGVISADDTDEVWPQSFVPDVMLSVEAVDVQR